MQSGHHRDERVVVDRVSEQKFQFAQNRGASGNPRSCLGAELEPTIGEPVGQTLHLLNDPRQDLGGMSGMALDQPVARTGIERTNPAISPVALVV